MFIVKSVSRLKNNVFTGKSVSRLTFYCIYIVYIYVYIYICVHICIKYNRLLCIQKSYWMELLTLTRDPESPFSIQLLCWSLNKNPQYLEAIYDFPIV